VKHSRYYRDALNKQPQTKIDGTTTVLQPFLYHTLVNHMAIPEMFIAVHCEHQRSVKLKVESKLGSVIGDLCRTSHH